MVMVNLKAADLLMVKAVHDNTTASTLTVEAKDPNITSKTKDNFKAKGIRGIITKVNAINLTTPTEDTSKVIATINSEEEAEALVNLVLMDAVMAGPIIKAITIPIPILWS